MRKTFDAQNGISIKLLIEKIKKEFEKENVQTHNKERKIISYNSGKLLASDWRNISLGFEVIRAFSREGFRIQERQMLSGEQDVSKTKKEIIKYKNIIEDFAKRISKGTRNEYELKRRVEVLSDYLPIVQASRDGVLVKQEKRIEVINGEKKEVIYDTSMTPKEVMSILTEYERKGDKLKFDRLSNYLGLGLGIIGVAGTVFKGNKEDKYDKDGSSIITLGTTAVGALKLLQGVIKIDDIRSKKWEISDKEFRIRDELLGNEQISSNAEKSEIKSIESLAKEEGKITRSIENRKLTLDIILDLAVAVISGIYINNKISIKENGKIDGKSLSAALISLQNRKEVAGNFINTAQGMLESKKENEEFEEICKKVNQILKQMDEKVYPLKGATHSFDSIEIKDFIGKFYPKKDYETGEIQYSTIIKVPEFSMKRGDVVLLSGESGTGKSTFLRLLKRGDINNTQAIKLDNGEMVDNLGDEYVSFRPSTNLGDETNVLYQITGEHNISDLTEEEQDNLLGMLRELKFDSPNLLEEIASKKFMEFSTGQQRRLALSKVFYRIDDGSSVIIVDEPVGNVEDSLIKEQLEIITKYAKSKNVMLILTTHRIDLAEDLATKRYNINKDGILEKVEIKNKDRDRDRDRE